MRTAVRRNERNNSLVRQFLMLLLTIAFGMLISISVQAKQPASSMQSSSSAAIANDLKTNAIELRMQSNTLTSK